MERLDDRIDFGLYAPYQETANTRVGDIQFVSRENDHGPRAGALGQQFIPLSHLVHDRMLRGVERNGTELLGQNRIIRQ